MIEEIKVTLFLALFVITCLAALGVWEYRQWEREIEKLESQALKELGRKYQKEITRRAFYSCVAMVVIVGALLSIPLIIQVVDELCG